MNWIEELTSLHSLRDLVHKPRNTFIDQSRQILAHDPAPLLQETLVIAFQATKLVE